MKKRKILFLGETYRADAITWISGLEEFGDFDIISWELKNPSHRAFFRILRIIEYLFAPIKVKKIIRLHKPDMVIAERTTSYGFLAALSGLKPTAIAQQGKTDLWPDDSIMLPIKKSIQNYAFKNATLIHAWGPVMANSMIKNNVDMSKVLILPKGIDLTKFNDINKATNDKIHAVVTRSLQKVYGHEVILNAFSIINKKGIDFSLTFVGDGPELEQLKKLARELQIDNKVIFTGRIPYTDLPNYLQKSNFYISMPMTEGVSASLFEAMASYCYPIVTDIEGNQSWITHRENGQLITLNDFEMLANEIVWAFENKSYREKAIENNRKFIEEKANYKTNMTLIATKYHELINLKN